MKQIKWHLLFYTGLLFTVFMLNACKPMKNIMSTPAPWIGNDITKNDPLTHDPTKKNVFIIADYKLTEMFDMLAPYYLFNSTNKANVYIVAASEKPILIKKNLFVKPQLTFDEIDARHMAADVIVIPALSVRTNLQDSIVVTWIKNHVTTGTRLLSVCDGASTGAATGLYDGKPLTCHASDYAGIKKYFQSPRWIQNTSVAKSSNLYSTAGVSNAVEGSLTVIEDIFGTEVMHNTMKEINYPHANIKMDHRSIAVNGRNKMTAFKKIFFKRNKNLGFILDDGISEFQMASILDTYARTFPATMTTYIPNDSTVKTKYGLRLIYTGGTAMPKIDELHVLNPATFTNEDKVRFAGAEVITYNMNEYPINACLNRISEQFGHKFAQLVKISLDYN